MIKIFSCSIFVHKLPTPGKLTITLNELRFNGKHFGGYDVNEIILWDNVKSIESTTWMMKRVIQISLIDSKVYHFLSFDHASDAFLILNHVWKYRPITLSSIDKGVNDEKTDRIIKKSLYAIDKAQHTLETLKSTQETLEKSKEINQVITSNIVLSDRLIQGFNSVGGTLVNLVSNFTPSIVKTKSNNDVIYEYKLSYPVLRISNDERSAHSEQFIAFTKSKLNIVSPKTRKLIIGFPYSDIQQIIVSNPFQFIIK